MPTPEYWKKRFKEQAESYYRRGDRSYKKLKALFKGSTNDIRNEIQTFYQKYGRIAESPTFTTLSDGTKVISGTSKKLVVPRLEAYKKLTEGTRLTKLEGQLSEILMNLSKDQYDYMKLTLSDIAENSYYDTLYEIHNGFGAGYKFNLLNENVISQLIRNPVNGQAFSTRIWNNRDRLANVVNQELRNGIRQGISNGQMARRLSDRMDSGYEVAERLIRTEITNTYNQATMKGYEASGIVEKYQYVATLDSNTSTICTNLDTEKFDIDEAVVNLNYPPMHPNCRSTTKAFFDDAVATRLARDVETGKAFTVPGDMSVKDYKDIYVNKTLTRAEWNKR